MQADGLITAIGEIDQVAKHRTQVLLRKFMK